MSKKHSWNWLAPRPAVYQLGQAAQIKGRRGCLAVIEQLGDRIMLSSSDGGPPPPTSSADILVSLVKAEINSNENGASLLGDQLSAMKLLSSTSGGVHFQKVVLSLRDSFVKIDDTLVSFGESLIKGEPQIQDKYDKALSDLNAEFAKIDDLVTNGLDQPAPEGLLPAVQFIETQAKQTLADLLVKGPAVDATSKGFGADISLQIADGIGDVTDGLVKLAGATVLAESKEDDQKLQEYLKYLEFLKINKLDTEIKDAKISPDAAQQLHNFVVAATDLANTLAQPPGDTPIDALKLLDNTGDVLT